MTLSDREQTDISKDYCRESYVVPNIAGRIGKGDVIAAAVALDAFVTKNLAALNTDLPEPFKSAATPSQKLKLFKFVVAKLSIK